MNENNFLSVSQRSKNDDDNREVDDTAALKSSELRSFREKTTSSKRSQRSFATEEKKQKSSQAKTKLHNDVSQIEQDMHKSPSKTSILLQPG